MTLSRTDKKLRPESFQAIRRFLVDRAKSEAGEGTISKSLLRYIKSTVVTDTESRFGILRDKVMVNFVQVKNEGSFIVIVMVEKFLSMFLISGASLRKNQGLIIGYASS